MTVICQLNLCKTKKSSHNKVSFFIIIRSKQLQTWYEQSNNLTIKQSKTKVKSENNTENDSKSQDEDEKNQPKSKKSKSVEKPADKKSKRSKTKIVDSENITEDDSKSQDEAEKTQLKSKKCNEKPISRKKDKLKTGKLIIYVLHNLCYINHF